MPMPTLPALFINKPSVVPVATLKREEAEAEFENISNKELGLLVPRPRLPELSRVSLGLEELSKRLIMGSMPSPLTESLAEGVVVPMPTSSVADRPPVI